MENYKVYVFQLWVKFECKTICKTIKKNYAFYLYLVPVSSSDVFIAGENLETLNNFRQSSYFLPMPDSSDLTVTPE